MPEILLYFIRLRNSQPVDHHVYRSRNAPEILPYDVSAADMQCPHGGCNKRQNGSGSNTGWWIRYELTDNIRSRLILIHRSGLIGGGADFTASSPELINLRQQLIYARQLFGIGDSEAPLPIGVGCLTMKSDAWKDNFVQLVSEYRPVAVWLFAYTHRSQHTELIRALRTAGRDWGLKVIVQVGTVESAREGIDDGADILSVQGSDAGGHQFKQGASLMALVPDVSDMLKREYPEKKIPLLAAGGIMDGRGVAGALMLGEIEQFYLSLDLADSQICPGAGGIVMGTRVSGSTSWITHTDCCSLYARRNVLSRTRSRLL
jgi:hypothetical protein